MDRKCVFITGANSGVGLALAHRVLNRDPSTRLCIGCRNRSRANIAKADLLKRFPEAEIMVLIVDVGNVQSVYRAAEELKANFDHLDTMFLNAGILPVSRVNWSNYINGMFSWRCIHMMQTGEGLLQQVDCTTTEGLRQVFATNVFGHFVLIKECESLLTGGDDTERLSQVIWTGSSNATASAFDLADIQNKRGYEPYGSSKYAVDLVSYGMNDSLNSKGIYSHTTCPGLVMSPLTYGILPSWFWFFIYPLLLLLRLFTHAMNYSPDNGAEAMYWLSTQDPRSVDPKNKFYSRCSFFGKQYTEVKPMGFERSLALQTFAKLDEMETECRKLFKNKESARMSGSTTVDSSVVSQKYTEVDS